MEKHVKDSASNKADDEDEENERWRTDSNKVRMLINQLMSYVEVMQSKTIFR